MLSTAPDIQDKPGATDLQVTAGAVEYHDVCFNYEDVELGEGDADERPVIDHMDLSIKPGRHRFGWPFGRRQVHDLFAAAALL